jgi:hypothetical protein
MHNTKPQELVHPLTYADVCKTKQNTKPQERAKKKKGSSTGTGF